MTRQLIIGAVLLLAVAGLPAVTAYANHGNRGNTGNAGNSGNAGNNSNTTNEESGDVKWVFVCKYVGKPGVDERLQTGRNPISVSVNAIQNNQWDGTAIPAWFSDAQDRSYVLEEDPVKGGGQKGEPLVNECPAPKGPEAPGSLGGTPGQGSVSTSGTAPFAPVVSGSTQPAAEVEVLPATSGGRTLAYALIAAGLATIVTGLIIGINALYRRSV